MESLIEQGKDGLYSLCVNTLVEEPESEVRKAFSIYGSIDRVHYVKEKLVFVRYTNREDAVECFRAMRNNLRFNVKPASSNSKRNNNGFDSGPRNSDMNRGGDQRRGGFSDMNRGGDRRRNDERSGENWHRGDGDSNRQGGYTNGDLPSLPPLVPAGLAHPKEVDKSGSPRAIEVIIGNLPPKTKQVDIISLCTTARVTPLHVTWKVLKKPPYRNINYARVFVKTEEDVNDIIDGLDGLMYQGHYLFVNTAVKLAESQKANLR